MKNSTKVKLVLLTFFIIFFSFLFWYFYQPTGDSNKDRIGDNTDVTLFPFDSTTNLDDIPDDTDIKNNFLNKKFTKEKINRLRQISNIPTAGLVFDSLDKKELHEFNVKNDIFGTDDAVVFDDHLSEIRFVSQKKGHIYSTYTNTTNVSRVSNTTILKVYEANFWDKDNLIVRYLDNNKNIKTYSVKLRKKTDREIAVEKENNKEKNISTNVNLLKFSGMFLPLNITDYTLLPDSYKIFYLKKDGEKTIGIKSESFGDNRVQIFESLLNEWNVKWKNNNHILLNTKASKDTYTLFFDLNTNNGVKKRLIDAVMSGNGLPNNSFTKIAYSGKDEEGDFHLYVYDLNKDENKDLGMTTLIEKCVWSKDNSSLYCAVPMLGLKYSEPDMWYKGYTNFSDSIYKIDTNTTMSEMIFDNISYGRDFDIVKMKLDNFEDYLYFIDSITNFAWSYRISPDKEEDTQEE